MQKITDKSDDRITGVVNQCMLDSKSVTRRVGDIGIRWEPPCRGEVTINCDGFLCGCG